MLGHRELTLDDYLEILRRRRWWIVVPTLVVPLIVLAISLKLPDRFTSQTLVLVEQQKVPDSFVKPVVQEDLDQRLATMQEQILSRTRLQPIIERFGLYKDEKVPMEDMVDRMRKAITVAPIRSELFNRTGGLPGFYISFTAGNPRLAQQVCTEITSMFMSENLKAREQSAQGTTDFLRGQLEDAKRKLDQQDAKLADFQRRYIGQLPGQEQANFSMLTTLNTQLDTTTQTLNRLQQDKTYTESLLSQQLASWRSLRSENSPQTLEQQLTQLQSQLISLEARYTGDHPDVVKMRKDIEVLKQKIAQSPSAPPADDKASPTEPPQIQQLRAQLNALSQGIEAKQADQRRIQQQINLYQGRIQLSPMIQEQYKSLTRDYQTALQFYNELLTKKNQSEMATDLERRQQGEQFRIMDPANLPEKPTFPNRPLLAGFGLAGGVVLGLTLAFVLELRDKSIRTERDVRFYLELPTLALMPQFAASNGRSPGSRKGLWRRSGAKPQNRRARQAVGA